MCLWWAVFVYNMLFACLTHVHWNLQLQAKQKLLNQSLDGLGLCQGRTIQTSNYEERELWRSSSPFGVVAQGCDLGVVV
jgi:hypothetical protein